MKKIANNICIYFMLASLFMSFLASYHFNKVSIENGIKERIEERARELICVSHYSTDIKMLSLYMKLKNKLESEGGSKISVEKTESLIRIYENELEKREYCKEIMN